MQLIDDPRTESTSLDARRAKVAAESRLTPRTQDVARRWLPIAAIDAALSEIQAGWDSEERANRQRDADLRLAYLCEMLFQTQEAT